MKSFIYYKGHDVYDLDINNTLNINSSINNDINNNNYNNNNNSIDICIFCLEEINNMINNIYKYNNYKYLHNCECKPTIHNSCFIEYTNLCKTCTICKTSITIRKSYMENLQENILYIFCNSLRYITVFLITYSLFQLGKIICFFILNDVF